MSDDPPVPKHSERTLRKPSNLWILGGFLLGGTIWFSTLLPFRDSSGLTILVFAAFILSPLAAVLSVIGKTRRFGFGLLLACGIGWLLLGAMWGGLIK